MKKRLKYIGKIGLLLFWGLRFRILRLGALVRNYRVIEQAGLFDADFYRQSLPPADRNRRAPYPLVHYLALGARSQDPHPLFDTDYYLKQNPQISDTAINPLVHYLNAGALQNRKPHPLFDTAYYLRQYRDVAEAGVNPLVHYLKRGAEERRRPSPLFDTEYYVSLYPDVVASGIHPLVHYLEYGAGEGRNPNPLFDTDYYLRHHPEAAESGMNPMVHYLEFGVSQGWKPNPLFDTVYYLRQNPDVATSGLDPLGHYLELGASEDRKPNPLFDPAYYRKRCPEALEAGINPLVHFLHHGNREGHDPYPLFDTGFYLQHYPDVVESGVNPLIHYLECGSADSRNPHALFDTAYYVRHYPDAAASGMNPLVHYLELGAPEGKKPHPLFDTIYYLESYPDVAQTGINPLLHYILFGAKEGRNPTPLFDSAFYLGKYGDVREGEMNPLVHYLQTGACEKRDPNPLFETAYYTEQYPDVVETGLNPLLHFVEHGALDGRKPNPLFDTAYYLKRYPDVKEAGINPLAHYLQSGVLEGKKPNPLFDTNYYLDTYPDVEATGINPLIHYLSRGEGEGRKPNPLFDPQYFREKYPWLAVRSKNLLAYYLDKGAAEGLDPGPDFDTAYYLEMSPDVARAGGNALVHYLEYGIREGRYPNNVYELWVQDHRMTDEQREQIRENIRSFVYRPTFSLIVPVYNTAEKWLRCCLDSVLAQLYPAWELCIADDASTDPRVRLILEEYRKKDARIRVVYRQENGHISASSNSALALATGEFVALLDHDDELAENALYENALLLNEQRDADMIYSDEDKLNEEGKRHSPFFKPDWSPDTFLSHMYTCHLGVYRTALVRDIGGFRVGFEGSQDYDLVLRLTEKTRKIHHIPKILYHWRAIHGSTALTYDSKNYAYKAGLKAISEALERRQEGGWVENVVNYPGQYLVHFPVVGNPLISIVIPTKDHPELLNQCLKSIFTKTTYPRFEVVVVDNGSIEEKTLNLLASWQAQEQDRLRVIRRDIPFNFSRLINEGVRQSQGELILLLNDDVEVLIENWLEEMAGQAQRPSIGAVGAFLYYPDRTLQHAGLILGVVGPANHAHRYAREDSPGYFGRLLIVTNYAAVTGACLMVKSQLFAEAGGLDEELAVAYNDVDFCLRLLKMGYRNVTLPQVRFIHHESMSRGSDRKGEKRMRLGQEANLMKKRWAAMIQNDPYYNPNLTRDREDFTLGFFSVKR